MDRSPRRRDDGHRFRPGAGLRDHLIEAHDDVLLCIHAYCLPPPLWRASGERTYWAHHGEVTGSESAVAAVPDIAVGKRVGMLFCVLSSMH